MLIRLAVLSLLILPSELPAQTTLERVVISCQTKYQIWHLKHTWQFHGRAEAEVLFAIYQNRRNPQGIPACALTPPPQRSWSVRVATYEFHQTQPFLRFIVLYSAKFEYAFFSETMVVHSKKPRRLRLSFGTPVPNEPGS